MNTPLAAYQFFSVIANGEKFAQNYGANPLGGLTAAVNVLSAAQNALSLVNTVNGVQSSIGLSMLGNALNKANLAGQVAALSSAISNDDPQGIAKGVIGLVGATAGVIGSIPGMPLNIAMPARAINLLATSATLLLSDPSVWESLSDLGEELSNAIKTSQEYWSAFFAASSSMTFSQIVNSSFQSARSFIQRSDPLTLDLDGDGLETVGINTTTPILFDHNADGVKTATGWVNSDDAFLVFDRNNNGLIDNGRELFGDSTQLYAGGTAADGFAALAQEDTNADGLVNAADANWASLKLWRDLNQDGISQSNELFTLESQNIAALKVAKTEHSQTLANKNQRGQHQLTSEPPDMPRCLRIQRSAVAGAQGLA